MHQPPDFPPIPKCFSHLISRVSNPDGEPCTHQATNSINSSCNNECLVIPNLDFSGRSEGEGLAKIHSDENVNQYIMNGTSINITCDPDIEAKCQGDSVGSLSKIETLAKELAQQTFEHSGHDVSEPPKNPYMKLNCSLLKLQKEMKDLRCIDMSLFCQLVSLHEAIQDFKLNVADRYSETGSEYSLGTASYMGSMSSLNDDSDWGEDGTLINSSNDLQDASEASESLDEASQSASSLLKQISDLALRVDEDF